MTTFLKCAEELDWRTYPLLALAAERARLLPDAVRRMDAELRDAQTPWRHAPPAGYQPKPYDILLAQDASELYKPEGKMDHLTNMVSGTRDRHAYMLVPDENGVLRTVVVGGEGAVPRPGNKRINALWGALPKRGRVTLENLRKVPEKYLSRLQAINAKSDQIRPIANLDEYLREAMTVDEAFEYPGTYRVMTPTKPLTAAEQGLIRSRLAPILGGSFTELDTSVAGMRNYLLGRGYDSRKPISTCAGGICNVYSGVRNLGSSGNALPQDFRTSPHLQESLNLRVPSTMGKPQLARLGRQAANRAFMGRAGMVAAPLAAAGALAAPTITSALSSKPQLSTAQMAMGALKQSSAGQGRTDMPFKSEAQRRYFNANREELESEGVDVDEWNASSKGKKLPEKVKQAEGGMAQNVPVTQPNLNVNSFENMRQRWLSDLQAGNRATVGGARQVGGEIGGTTGAAGGALAGAMGGGRIGQRLAGATPGNLMAGMTTRGGPSASQIQQRWSGVQKGRGRGGMIGGLLMALLGQWLGRKGGRGIGEGIGGMMTREAPEHMKTPVSPATAGDVASTLAKSSSHNLGLKAARCWDGYEPVPGKEPYSEDSCRSKSKSKEKQSMDAKKCECGKAGCPSCGQHKMATSCGGGMKKKKKKMAGAELKKAATASLQRYLAHLYKQAQDPDAPLHYKRAADERLVKLSQSLAQTGDLWTSLGKVYPEFDAEKRFKVAQSIASGMFRWLGKKAMGGMASAGGAGMMGSGMKMAPSGSQTLQMSAGTKMPAM